MSRTFHRLAKTETRAVRIPTSRLNPQGVTLARELARHIGTSEAITVLCSHIASEADVVQRYAHVGTFDRPLTSDEVQRAARAENTIRSLVAYLPRSEHGPLVATFEGDPGGYVCAIRVPGVPHLGNTFGLGGDYGVGAYLARD